MLLRAAQQASEAAESSRAMANRLLGVAERFVWQARGPVTIAVGGLSASGKTTLAKALARRAGLPYLSSDVARKRGAGLPPTQRADPALYAPEVSRRLYVQLGACAALQPGGAIVDATFRRIRERDAFRDGHGAARRVLYVECVAPCAWPARTPASGRPAARRMPAPRRPATDDGRARRARTGQPRRRTR